MSTTPFRHKQALFPRPCPAIKGLCYGGDYSPQQWPESVWREDMRLMREAGVNLVSIAIFAWAKLEPVPGRYDFGWLDRLMALLAGSGIKADLATATASPPAWMARLFPDSLATDGEGRIYSPGSRQHYSPFSPHYRRHAAALTRQLARRYHRHLALAMWHVNNEYACHVSEDHGRHATREFRRWLKKKYRTIGALNAAWGTAFWSQHYSVWEEICTPRHVPTFGNPTQQLDFKRFMSDSILALYVAEAAILRRESPGIPVTTNFMGFFKPIDQWRWARELDFSSWDSYPDPLLGSRARESAAAGHDLTRSLISGRPWLLMEQVTSQVNWRPINPLKRPEVMRLLSMQAVARGSDGAMFFPWRASRAGAEKFHGAMVPHVGGQAASRVWREVCALGADFRKLASVSGSLIQARAAIVLSWDAWWAVELKSKPAQFDYPAWLQEFHAWFLRRNIAVDFLPPDADCSGYRLIVAPALYLLAEKDARSLTHWVQTGGTLVATYFTGVVDEYDHIVIGGYPAYLREALGLWVEEWDPLPENTLQAVRFGRRGRQVPASHWADLIHLEGARPLAFFSRDFYAGRPAVTEHSYGSDKAFYLATKMGGDGLTILLDLACAHAGVAPVGQTPDGVEVTERAHANGVRYFYLLNHNVTPAIVPLAARSGVDLLTGRRHSGRFRLGPNGVVVLRLNP